MKLRPHISFSEWMLFETCQWRWMRDYLEDRRLRDFSIHLTFGNSMHHALEKLKDPDPEKRIPSVDEVCEVFEENFVKRFLKESEKYETSVTDEEFKTLLASGKRIIKSLDELDELKSAQVLFVEYQLFEDIKRTDDVKIKFKGFIDIVIKTKNKKGKSIVYLIDYKTCSWGWSREKKTDEKVLAQLRLYKHFFSKKFNIDPSLVKTAFVLLKKTGTPGNEVEWLPFSSGNKTTIRAVARLNRAITIMKTNDFKKNKDACTWKGTPRCPYYKTELCIDD